MSSEPQLLLSIKTCQPKEDSRPEIWVDSLWRVQGKTERVLSRSKYCESRKMDCADYHSQQCCCDRGLHVGCRHPVHLARPQIRKESRQAARKWRTEGERSDEERVPRNSAGPFGRYGKTLLWDKKVKIWTVMRSVWTALSWRGLIGRARAPTSNKALSLPQNQTLLPYRRLRRNDPKTKRLNGWKDWRSGYQNWNIRCRPVVRRTSNKRKNSPSPSNDRHSDEGDNDKGSNGSLIMVAWRPFGLVLQQLSRIVGKPQCGTVNFKPLFVIEYGVFPGSPSDWRDWRSWIQEPRCLLSLRMNQAKGRAYQNGLVQKSKSRRRLTRHLTIWLSRAHVWEILFSLRHIVMACWHRICREGRRRLAICSTLLVCRLETQLISVATLALCIFSDTGLQYCHGRNICRYFFFILMQFHLQSKKMTLEGAVSSWRVHTRVNHVLCAKLLLMSKAWILRTSKR